MNPSKMEPKRVLKCLVVEGCDSLLEILGSVLILVTSLLSPSFPFAVYQLNQEKKVIMRFKRPDLIDHVCNQLLHTF